MAAHSHGAVPDDVRAAAEHYLRQGFLPVPVPRKGRGKAPALEGWQDLRPRPDDLDGLFPPGQALNVGLLLGAPSGGLVDVDLDTAEAVAAAPFLLPPTGWVSGRKGRPRSHWWYLVQDPPDKAQDKYIDLGGTDLLELRSTGGQTVAPPGLHESGEPIVWHTCSRPAEAGVGDLLASARAVAAVALLARHWPGKGARQDGFLALAGGLLRAGRAQEHVGRLVQALAAATGDEEAGKRAQAVGQTARKLEQEQKAAGWPKLEALIGPAGKDVVRRARQWLGLAHEPVAATSAKGKVRVLEPYRPFPVEALPAPVGDYVRQGALALGCDPAYLALPALAVAASAVGNTRAVRLKRGWEEPCVVWSVIVGDSGTLKSPAYLKAVAHLFRLQKRLLGEFKQKAAAYQNELQEYRDRKRKAKEDGDDPGEPPEEPLLQRVVCSDTTIEKLAEILEDNPRGTLVARDELAGWLGSFTRYKGRQGGSDLPNWLEMHRAGTVVVDRKTGERRTLFIPRAAASVTGGIQPGVLARTLTPEFLDAGLAARLLMAMPPKLPKRWSEAEVDPRVEAAYQDVLDRLLALGFDACDGERAPHALPLSRDGKAAWVAFYNDWAREQAAAEGELAAAFSKLEAYAARLALLHHVVTHVYLDAGDVRAVGARSVEAGVALARWFAREARRIYTTLSESAEERETRRLVEFLQARGGRITVRGLMRANCRRYPDAEAAEAALAALVEAGRARWAELAPRPRGRPVRAVELCVTHDTHDTEDDGDEGDGPAARGGGPDGGPGPGPPALEAAGPEGLAWTPPDRVMRVMRHAGAIDTPSDGRAGRSGCSEEGTPPCAGASQPGSVVRAEVAATVPHRLVRDRAGVDLVAAALDDVGLVGLDLETTGLDPRTDRVRLLALAVPTTDGGTFCYLVDCFVIDPRPLFDRLAEKGLVAHNAAFDLGFLARLGFTPAGPVHDTMLLAQLLAAGTGERVTLAACCTRYLGLTLDKGGQKSDWAGGLTDQQLAYAARDAEVLAPLYQALVGRAREAGLGEAAEIEERCLPAVLWMSRHGVALDRDAWLALARAADEEAGRLRQELNQAAPLCPGSGLFPGPWNWDSAPQARQALALAGCDVADTADETLAAAGHPLAELLRRYRLARKRGGTYGPDWLKHVAGDGRVYPTWRQVGAASGRMSCSGPNLQQLPRGDHRRCVVAPPGRVLVRADYGQVELRIAAKVSGDQALLAAYRRGEDLHARTARSVLGVADVTKEHRQLAKALNFGLLYGMGARGFRRYARAQYGLALTEEEARRYRNAFFKAYPGLATWHRRVRLRKAAETRTLAGRRRLLDERTPDTRRLNTPVQGTGADGLKRALALLWERRQEVPGAFPALAVHDEIVVECDQGQADVVAAWLRTAMVEAMVPLLDPVPVEVEVQVARTWGGE